MKAAAMRAVLYLGVVYLTAGLLFGTLAGQAASTQVRVAWRWAAWVVSAIAFGAHIMRRLFLRTNIPSSSCYRSQYGRS
jgi:hypothetical protein